MPVLAQVDPAQASEKVQELLGRVEEKLGAAALPGFKQMANVEAFLQDSFMNYRKFLHEGAGNLDHKTREAIALATASALNCSHCVKAHAKAAQAVGWSQQEVAEILSVVATCAMYNTYYKFKDLAGDSKFESMSPQLRAHTFMKTSLDDKLVELINVVVSNINGCPQCTTGHTRKAIELGLSHEDVDEAIRVSALMSSFATFFRTQ